MCIRDSIRASPSCFLNSKYNENTSNGINEIVPDGIDVGGPGKGGVDVGSGIIFKKRLN